MGEGLLQPHQCTVPSPAEPSNEVPAFDMDEVHIEECKEVPSPKLRSTLLFHLSLSLA